MIVDLVVPELGESISEVEIGSWHKKEGEFVERDEPLVDVESQKATVEVPAPESGVLTSILKQTGEEALVGEIIAKIDTELTQTKARTLKSVPPAVQQNGEEEDVGEDETPATEPRVMPAAKRILEQNRMAAKEVTPTGPGERILKEDALGAVAKKSTHPRPEAGSPREPEVAVVEGQGTRSEQAVRMTPLRRTIAARLVQAKQEAALLTTFNEIDMSKVKAMRKELGEEFLEKHGVKLGFMSFFVKATVASLKDFPSLNGEIRGNEAIYKDYCDIGIAVGGGKGLVVPVLRNAELMSFADIERTIAELGSKARSGKLSPSDLEGGSFSISNGGIYGSMLSTPIINPPQSGILGLHAIKDRAVAIDGEVVIRPIMYVALTYDHRLVDGREAVSFLKSVVQRMENPARMMLEI